MSISRKKRAISRPKTQTPVSRIDRYIEKYYTPLLPAAERPSFLALSHTERRAKSSQWFDAQVEEGGYENLALFLAAEIQKVIRNLEKTLLPKEEKGRFFARIDRDHFVKSGLSILDKLSRPGMWNPVEDKSPKVKPGQFMRSKHFHDLARFRIVCNFLIDADWIRDALIRESDESTPATNRSSAIMDFFDLDDNEFEDKIHIAPRDRKTGERCYKQTFQHKETGIKIEVQIMTQAAESWDKKDHPLQYEPRRRGEEIVDSDAQTLFSISEALYLLDFQSDKLLAEQRVRRSR